MAKYADFINQQAGKQLEQSNRRSKYSGWIEDPSTGQGRAIDTEGNIVKLAQKPAESEFTPKPTDAPKGDYIQSNTGQYAQRNVGGGSYREEYAGEFDQKPEMGSFDIDALPEQEFNIGKLAIQNEFVKETNLAKQTTTDTVQIDEMINDAKMTKAMRMQELMTNYQRTKTMFKKYGQEGNLSNEDKFLAKMTFHDSNPVFKIPQASLKPAKPTYTQAQQQRGIGKIISESGGVYDREMILDAASEVFGPDFDETAPLVMQYIEKNFPQDGSQIQQQQQQPNQTQLKEMSRKPIQIKSDDDFDKLPSGATFIDPQGNVRRKQ